MATGEVPELRISIVIPTYNRAGFLREAVRSLVEQNYANLQLIVVDGGSTDRTHEVVKEYKEHIDVFISEPDSGPADAINKGFQMANGDWFNWLGSDDLLLPGALRALAMIIDRAPEANWISGARLILGPDGLFSAPTSAWQSSPLLVPLGFGPLPQESTFLKRTFLPSNGPLLEMDARCLFDQILYRRLFEREMPLLTNLAFGAMRWHSSQISSAQRAERSKEYHYFRQMNERLPRFQRLLERALRTRFSPLVTATLLAASYYGVLPYCKDMKLFYFDVNDLTYKIGLARELIYREI